MFSRSNAAKARSARFLSAALARAIALEAALAWYRAQRELRVELGSIRVPVMYIWGDADYTVTPMAAEGTADFVSGPWRFVKLPGVGHFSTDQQPERVSELLLEHLRAYPV
jgi:pimeloyl-ACP methyl ester carboxylesterase